MVPNVTPRVGLLESVLYPCVRVRAGKIGGSGTIIYSEPAVGAERDYHTYVLTCHHVIKDAIHLKEEWDPLIGRDRKRERRERVIVESFKWQYGTRTVGVTSDDADIEVWDEKYDLAVLRLRSSEPASHVARFFPHNRTREIQMLDPVYAVGCALGHSPILTAGRITAMSDEVDGISFWMSDAQIIFGNSGGAIFHGERLEFIGVPSMIEVIGWATPITHMGYFSDAERIYRWLQDECYHFLYDRGVTSQICTDLRKEKREKERALFERQVPAIETEPGSPQR